MSMKMGDDPMGTTFADQDQLRIESVLSFWFQEGTQTAPQIDERMDVWFGSDPAFDREIEDLFRTEVEKASRGELDHWADESRGRLALILLIDQFRRNIFRGTADAFAADNKALKLCLEGAMKKQDASLTPIQRAFFYMPLQHSESKKVQAKSVAVFNQLADAVSPTLKETFLTIAHFAELHHDIVARFDRFPHRNKVLGRQNTDAENEFLSGEAPDFGQSDS